MAKAPARALRPTASRKDAPEKDANLMVRLDRDAKALIASAANMRGISTSDYVRSVVVGQARREVEEARTRVLALSPDEQLLFWNALQKPTALTKRQRKLGKLMRAER